jgi:hypothetical protein
MNDDTIVTLTITGRPVASAHANKVGRGFLYKSKEWMTWIASAILQVENTLVAHGHEVIREPLIRKGKPYKNEHGQNSRVVNPLFAGGTYRVIVWYFRPQNIQLKDATGAPKFTKGTKKEPSRPIMRAYTGLDADNPIKGAVDALQEGGVIDNDRNVRMVVGVELPVLPDGVEPYLAVEVKTFDGSAEDWTIPRPPVHLVDPSLYMPRVLKPKDWYKFKKEEQGYLDQMKQVVQPVTKCRCRQCQINIGPHWHETSVYWMKTENAVVLICAHCADKNGRAYVEPFLNNAAMAAMRKRGIPVTDPDDLDSIDYPIFRRMRELAEQKLVSEYMDRHRLVASDEIIQVSWKEISRRKSEIQKEQFPHDTDRHPVLPSRGRVSAPAHQPRSHSGVGFGSCIELNKLRRSVLFGSSSQSRGEVSESSQ